MSAIDRFHAARLRCQEANAAMVRASAELRAERLAARVRSIDPSEDTNNEESADDGNEE